MLDQRTRKHLENNWIGVKLETQKSSISRIKADVPETLKDLALITEKLPEKHLASILTVETLIPFIKALVDIGPLGPSPTDAEGRPVAGPHALTEDQQKKMARIRPLCSEILRELARHSEILAPKATDILRASRSEADYSARLQALLIGQ